jgi:hypothetical protein
MASRLVQEMALETPAVAKEPAQPSAARPGGLFRRAWPADSR